MDPQKRDFTHLTSAGNTLHLSVYGSDGFGEKPCVVFLHGLLGYKDWGFIPYLGEAFAAKGFSFVTFNFSHNGVHPENPHAITDKAAFERNTYSMEVREAEEVYYLCKNTAFFGASAPSVGVLGHSRGGSVALVSGRNSTDVAAVATWAAMATFLRQDKKERTKWRSAGFREIVDNTTKETYRCGLPLLDDLEKNVKGRLHIQQATKELNRPLFILHGSNDEIVPYFEAEHLNIYANPSVSAFKLIPGANHVLGAKEPWAGTTPYIEDALGATLAFFENNLAKR